MIAGVDEAVVDATPFRGWKVKMKNVAVRFAILGALFWNGAAFAQNPQVIDRIKAWNAAAPTPADDIIAEELNKAVSEYAKANNICRPQVVEVTSVAPITGARLVLQAVASGQARNGWSVMTEQRGCGENRPVRYVMIQKADNSLIVGRVNEGRSNANLSLMRDTSAAAAVAAYGAVKRIDASCDGKGPRMGVTRIAQESSDLGPEIFGVRYVGSWTEIWPFTICNRTAEVKITFRADGDGGAYTDVPGDQVVVLPAPK